jgi:hypothetical protein
MLQAGEAAALRAKQQAAAPQAAGDNAGGGSRGLGKGALRLVERFVPVNERTIFYYATFDAPTIWTRPWTFMLPWQRDDTYQLHEYACHEGDLSIENALRGERLLERQRGERP